MATTITRKQLREGSAQDLGLMVKVSLAQQADIDTTAHTIILPDLFTKFPDQWGLRDGWITYDGESYRRIIKYSEPQTGTQEVMLDGNLSGIPTNAAVYPIELTVYRLLSPEDWNNELNEALESLYREMRVEVNLVSNQSDYPFDEQVDSDGDLCSYVQSRTQVYDVQFQSQYNQNWNQSYGYSAVAYLKDNNALTARLTSYPLIIAGAQLIFVVRKPYVWRDNLLSLDTDTTNCPYRLAMLQLQMNAIRLLFKRHGQAMKSNFAAVAQVTERQLAQERNEWIPAARPQSYQIDEPYAPDLSPFEIQWSW